MRLLVLLCCLLVVASGQFGFPDGGASQATNTPSPPTTTASPTTNPTSSGETIATTLPTASTASTAAPTTAGPTTTATSAPTTTPSPCCNSQGAATEVNFDFKGILAGAQGGNCNCAQKQQCSQCAYGAFGYPCIADPCDQCPCGGGNAVPPGSACLPCQAAGTCSVAGSPSSCLTGVNGNVCQPNLQIYRKSLFLGDQPQVPTTDFYLEVSFYFQANWCHYLVNFACSKPTTQVNLFALQYQFGTKLGQDDPNAQCSGGLRYTVINNTNVNYNIVPQSLVYDPRFSVNGVTGLFFTGSGYAGASSTSPNFRDTSMVCPPGLTPANLPKSFAVVINGANIQAAALNNVLDNTTDPNPYNWGSHWIALPDRGVCVGDPNLASQNAGNYLLYDTTNATCNPCFFEAGPPVYANPPSPFKRDEQLAPVSELQSTGLLFGPSFGH